MSAALKIFGLKNEVVQNKKENEPKVGLEKGRGIQQVQLK